MYKTFYIFYLIFIIYLVSVINKSGEEAALILFTDVRNLFYILLGIITIFMGSLIYMSNRERMKSFMPFVISYVFLMAFAFKISIAFYNLYLLIEELFT